MDVRLAECTSGKVIVHPSFIPVILSDSTIPHDVCVASSGAYTYTLIWVSRWLKARRAIFVFLSPSLKGVAIISVAQSIVPRCTTYVHCVKVTPLRLGYQPISLVCIPFAK
jgi:hypothetical protein